MNANAIDCQDIKALLSGLIDDEVDPRTRHEAERHLAGCASCRELISEAESLNNFIALDAQRNLWPVGLPAGFEDTVLRQTIFAEAYQYAGRKWTSWLGWVAAAACLGLAISLWFLNPRSVQPGPAKYIVSTPSVDDRESDATRLINAYATNARSWTYEGGLPPEALTGPARTVQQESDAARITTVALTRPRSAFDDVEPISRDDADTLYAASTLLGMLEHAEFDSFSQVERIRQIAEYDELLDRLAESRERLSAADRPAVIAAEGILLRVVNGPISTDDLRVLNQTVASLDLPQQIESISSRWQPPSSL